MTKDEAIDAVRKLYAKADSTEYEHERQAFQEGARKMRDKYNISDADLGVDPVGAPAGGPTGGPGAPEEREFMPDPANPMQVARVLLDEDTYRWQKLYTLHSWRGEFMRWEGSHWRVMESNALDSELYHRLENTVYLKISGDKANVEPWAPTPGKIRNLRTAMAGIVFLPRDLQPPTHLDGGEVRGIVAVENGLLDVATKKLSPHTPLFFNEISVPFRYEASAPAPVRWMQFLEQLWPDDPEAIKLLQEWFGYVLSGQTNQQKMLGLIGPMRSGKSTIGRVLTGLVGRENVAAPPLASFGQHFGLYDLIRKPIAIIDDVRLGPGLHAELTERLLSITGEGTLTVDIKYKDPWTGQLPTRVMFLSNELPRFADASGTIASRIMLLLTSKSFLDKEDKELTPKLLAELPGILNWSLAGLATLTKRGKFSEPKSSIDAKNALRELASPISAFLREWCALEGEVGVQALYAAWRDWADQAGHQIGNEQVFGQKLRAVHPTVKISNRRRAGKQMRFYVGISLRSDSDDS